MQEWWQHLPETIQPIAFSVGFFSVYWYAIFFLSAFFASYLVARLFVQRGESPFSGGEILDVFLFLFLGALIGGRIGYVLFYHFDLFLLSPFSILSPYDFASGVWTGISGMSFHGGLIGVGTTLFLLVRTKKLTKERRFFWRTADFLALLAPIAIFFGRLGNFFNVELYGRMTEKSWGMIFPQVFPVGTLRHPSTLYEAFFEGIVLFVSLLFVRKKMPFAGSLTCLFLSGYAIARFIGECFREPDPQMGLYFYEIFSFGQILSLVMFVCGVMLFLWLQKTSRAKIEK